MIAFLCVAAFAVLAIAAELALEAADDRDLSDGVPDNR